MAVKQTIILIASALITSRLGTGIAWNVWLPGQPIQRPVSLPNNADEGHVTLHNELRVSSEERDVLGEISGKEHGIRLAVEFGSTSTLILTLMMMTTP